MKLAHLLGTAAATLWLVVASPAGAQAPAQLGSCDQPHLRVVERGQTLTIDCDFAVVLNDKQAAAMMIKGETFGRLMTLLQRRKQLSDELSVSQDLLVASAKQVDEIQERYYAQLRADVATLEQLTRRAADNADQAVALAQRSRFAGWASSSLVGAVGGGVVGLQRGDSWRGSSLLALTGAVVGLAVGYAINH